MPIRLSSLSCRLGNPDLSVVLASLNENVGKSLKGANILLSCGEEFALVRCFKKNSEASHLPHRVRDVFVSELSIPVIT